MPKLTFPQTLERIGHDDVIDAVKAYVTGQCFEHNRYNGVFTDLKSHGYELWVSNNFDQVWKYLNGQSQIDASYGDFAAVTCHKAAKVFGWPEERRPAVQWSIGNTYLPEVRDDIRAMDWDRFASKVYEEIVGNRFVNAIKAIRVRFGCGLYDGKAMAEVVRDGTTSMNLHDLALCFEAGRLREAYLERLVDDNWTHFHIEAAFGEGWDFIQTADMGWCPQPLDPEFMTKQMLGTILRNGTGPHHVMARRLVRETHPGLASVWGLS